MPWELGGIIQVQTECEYDLTLSWIYRTRHSRTSKLKDAIGFHRQGWPMKSGLDMLTRNARISGQVWGLTVLLTAAS